MPGRQPSEVHGVNSRLGSCGAHRSSVGESGIPQIAANRLLVKHRAALGSSLRYLRVHAPEKLQRSMADLLAWYGGGGGNRRSMPPTPPSARAGPRNADPSAR